MEYRPLGHTDLRVSSLCLGTMTWGNQNSAEEGFAQMDLALDRGINFFDTAEMYAVPASAETSGRTEEIIGQWFARTGNRDKVVLATKAAGPGDYVKHIRGGPRLNQDHLERAVETSLKRLQTGRYRRLPAALAGAYHQLLRPSGLQAPRRPGRGAHRRDRSRPEKAGGQRQDPPLGAVQ